MSPDDNELKGGAGGEEADAPEQLSAPSPAPAPRPAGPPPTFWQTLLADLEWSGGPVDVDDDRDPDAWRRARVDRRRLFNSLSNLGFYATVMYRLSRWCRVRGMPFLSAPLQMLNHVVTGAEISHKAEIAPGLRIGHPQGVFIGPGSKVGMRSTFNQGTALSSNMDVEEGAPQVGTYLYMSPGAKVFGAVKLGDRVWVGPNSVALKDVEDDKVVLGVPGRAMPSSLRAK